MSERNRIHWHCRRGLLELDLVLDAFVERRLDALDKREVAAFKKLLEYSDNDLLDLVMGRAELKQDAECAPVLLALRQIGAQ